ncbi:MAG: hypothetical protein ABF289_06590 [Clostridiales bacterium]
MPYNIKLSNSQFEVLKEYIGNDSNEYEKALYNFYEQKEKEPIIQFCSILENLVRKIYIGIYNKQTGTLEAMIEKLVSNGKIPNEIATGVHFLRVIANKIRHNSLKSEITIFDTENCIRICLRIIIWYITEYERDPKRDKTLFINEEHEKSGSFSDKVNQIDKIISESLVIQQILNLLILKKRASVDHMTTKLNLSRIIIIQSVTKLLEHQLIRWEEHGEEILILNDKVYNLEYIIEKVLNKNEA